MHVTESGRWLAGDHDASLEQLILSLRESRVDKAVILPIAGIISNEFVAEACSNYPDELIGFASVNPLEDGAPKILEAARKELNLRGLKLHPRLQGFDLNDGHVLPVIHQAASLGLPVLIDAWVHPAASGDFGLLDSIVRIASKVPSAKMIVAHLGGLNRSRVSQIAQYDNLYFDISFVLKYVIDYDVRLIYDEIIPVMRELGPSRLIYGSDHPEANLRDYFELTERVFDSVSLPAEDRACIYGKTLCSLGLQL